MGEYSLTKKAKKDLGSIWNSTYERWSENQADKYYKLLLVAFGDIAENPDSGRSYESVFADLKGVRVGRHIIFYRVLHNDLVEITRILHDRMDLKSRLGEV